jgi:hypothetical protein
MTSGDPCEQLMCENCSIDHDRHSQNMALPSATSPQNPSPGRPARCATDSGSGKGSPYGWRGTDRPSVGTGRRCAPWTSTSVTRWPICLRCSPDPTRTPRHGAARVGSSKSAPQPSTGPTNQTSPARSRTRAGRWVRCRVVQAPRTPDAAAFPSPPGGRCATGSPQVGRPTHLSRLTGCRGLDHRYERRSGSHPAFLGLAAALCRYERLARPTR